MKNKIFSIISIIIYIILFLYLIIKLLLEHYKKHIIANWDTYKLNPFIIPIAGFFKKEGFPKIKKAGPNFKWDSFPFGPSPKFRT